MGYDKRKHNRFLVNDQKQKQLQGQVQGQIDTDTISNVGNPVVNVNVGLAPPHPKSTSSFRALNTTVIQPLAANTFIKVLFPTKQFDLENEYDPATSTFTPKSPGVYSIIASINFAPTNPFQNYRARVEIHVNGGAAVAIDNDFFGPTIPSFVNVASVSAILQLQAGDRVEVFATANISGTLEGPNVADPGAGSNFQAAKF